MLRFCNLGSGSSGNATLIEARSEHRVTRLLVDCGLPLRELSVRLGAHGLAPADLDAVFVTHEHSDHAGAALALSRRHRKPLIASEGTWRAMRRERPEPENLRLVRDGEMFAVGDLQVLPFAVPHDAEEPLQLCVSDGAVRLGLVTDLGDITPAVVARLQRCQALLLECNHDARMLAEGPYPAFLKRRIGGPRGHLANAQSAALLRACLHAGLRHVVAAHLSRHNNRPELAARALAGVWSGVAADVLVADPVHGSPWLQVG